MSEFRIESGWLVRDVNEHTCGGSSTEWPYAHEPGCGTIPELRLDDLPGWPGAEVERLRTALIDLVDDWEDTGRSDLHPLIRGAVLSAAGQVRDVLWPDEAPESEGVLPLHRTEAGYPNCSTCDGGGCLDCTDPA